MECIGWALYASGVGFVALCAFVGPFLPREGAWKRCSELRRLGLIEPTGSTRRGSSGREQRVSRWTGGAR